MRSVIALSLWLMIASASGCGDGSQGTTSPAQPVAAAQSRRYVGTQPAATGGAELVAKACELLAEELAGKLPKDRVVAVLPMLDDDGGVRRLGVLAADELQRLLLARGVRLADRQHVNALLLEQDLQLALLSSSGGAAKAGAIAGAGVLVLGAVTDAGENVLISAKAIAVKSGEALVITKSQSLPAKGLDHLMWYVRRPAEEAAGGELPPLSLAYEFVSPAGAGETKLADGSTVTTNQKFKIRVQANSDCYLYVLLYDSAGKAGILFPHEKIGLPNRVRGGVSYEIPAGTKWYWFDERSGAETFYLVAGYRELGELDRLLAKMEQAGGPLQAGGAARAHIDQVIVRGMSPEHAAEFVPKGMTVKGRGVGGVTDLGPGGGRSTPEMDEVVNGHATVVKKVVLNHR